MIKIYHDEPESPHERACLRSMMYRNRQMMGMLKTYDELDSTNDLACLRSMFNNNNNRNNNTIWGVC